MSMPRDFNERNTCWMIQRPAVPVDDLMRLGRRRHLMRGQQPPMLGLRTFGRIDLAHIDHPQRHRLGRFATAAHAGAYRAAQFDRIEAQRHRGLARAASRSNSVTPAYRRRP